MTTFAMSKTIIATNVGSFPEYIKNGFNGLLTDANSESLGNSINKALHNKYYQYLESNVKSCYSEKISRYNKNEILKAYHEVL